MIEINLLPLEKRKKKPKIAIDISISQRYLIWGGGALALLLILTWVGAGMFLRSGKGKLEVLKGEYQAKKKDADEVARLQEEREKLKKKRDSIQQLMDGRLQWAKKLNQLSNLIPAHVWLKSLSLRREQVMPRDKPKPKKGKKGKEEKKEKEVKKVNTYLLIKGNVLSPEEEKGIETIGEFMRRIREDGEFYVDFIGDVGCSDIRRVAGTDVFEFELKCQFKKNP